MTPTATAAATPGQLPAAPDALYDALCQRDPAFEGLFFACVTTTGIFCRPTCSARKPRRENVEFVATAQQALLAGYRPCRICHPLAVPTDAPDWLADLMRQAQTPGADPIRERELRNMGLDPDHVRRQFKRHCGMSLSAFQRAVRLGAALRAIREGAAPTLRSVFVGSVKDARIQSQNVVVGKVFKRGRARETEWVWVGTVKQRVAIGIRIARTRAEHQHLVSVTQPVAVAVRIERVGTVAAGRYINFSGVKQAIAVGVPRQPK